MRRPSLPAAGLLAVALVTGCAGGGAGGRDAAAPGTFCPGHLALDRPVYASTDRTALPGRVVPAARRGETVPLGVSADGRTAYVSTWTPRFSGVAALSLTDGVLSPIWRFADPATDQADGAWGGRWLVWEQTTSLRSLDSFTVFAWDSVTGAVRRLGHSLAAPSGTAWPSPWHAPAVGGGYAAWAQGYGPGGLVEIRLADLRTGRSRVVARGHVQAPFFDRRLLVWPESDRPGALTTLRGYDVGTGAMAALPAVLRLVRGTDEVATDGTRTAYLNPAMDALFYSPAPGQAAVVVLRLPAGIAYDNVGLGLGTITWTTTGATYLASTRTGRYLRVTAAYGFAVPGSGAAVLISGAPAGQAAHPVLPLRELDAAVIGGVACR